jgi:tRNA pseudouridine13 synthase
MNNPALALGKPSHMESLAYAYGVPTARGRLRCAPEDFQVQEALSFEPSGKGDHVYLVVQKRQLTTEAVSQAIARLANVSVRHVGYAGLKDRNAVTSQWFSVDLAGKPEPDWGQLESDSVRLQSASRHERKLKRGSIEANKFHLIVRHLHADKEQLESRLTQVQRRGVPNYFGEQRFGIEENNLHAAIDMFTTGRKVKNRHLRGLYYSAARSFLFNQVLSYRVGHSLWDQAVSGDAMVLQGSRSFFVATSIDDSIRQRLLTGDIHPSGPLWGRGEPATQGEAKALELKVLEPYHQLRQGLERHGLEQQRRALRLPVSNFQWEFAGQDLLHLRFALPSGAYATSVVRELVSLT